MPATEAKLVLPVMYNGSQCHANCPALDRWDNMIEAFKPAPDHGFCRYFDDEVGLWPGTRLTECVDAEAK